MALPHKIKDNNTNDVDVLPSDNDQWFSDGQLDVIAAVLAETRAELRDEWQAAIDKAVTELRGEKDLHEAIAELRGQLAAVMNLFGNGPKLFEAEQTVRKLKISAGEGGHEPRRRICASCCVARFCRADQARCATRRASQTTYRCQSQVWRGDYWVAPRVGNRAARAECFADAQRMVRAEA